MSVRISASSAVTVTPIPQYRHVNAIIESNQGKVFSLPHEGHASAQKANDIDISISVDSATLPGTIWPGSAGNRSSRALFNAAVALSFCCGSSAHVEQFLEGNNGYAHKATVWIPKHTKSLNCLFRRRRVHRRQAYWCAPMNFYTQSLLNAGRCVVLVHAF
jgi:hypothetical protein